MFRYIVLFFLLLILIAGEPNVAAANPEESALAESRSGLVLLINKAVHTLTVYSAGKEINRYPVVFGVNPVGDKEREGDNRTPEGSFYVTDKERLNEHPFLGKEWVGLSYPDISHAERALDEAVIDATQYKAIVTANNSRVMPPQNTALGGWIGIHGGREELTRQGIDWTEGCIAMMDKDLDELFAILAPGTKVIITSKLPG